MPLSAELDLHLANILLAWSIILMGVISPGPAVMGIIGTSLEYGRKQGFQFTLGVVCGSAIWGIIAALGMAAILVAFAGALTLIKIAGAIYLFWLALKSVQSATGKEKDEISSVVRDYSFSRIWLAGFLIHLTNPKAILGWIATIALGVTPASPLWVTFVIVVGGVLISLTGHMAYAVLFSTRPVVSAYLKAKKPIALAFGALFGFAGYKLLTSRIE